MSETNKGLLLAVGVGAAIIGLAAILSDDEQDKLDSTQRPSYKPYDDYLERAYGFLAKEDYPEAVLEVSKLLAQVIRDRSGITDADGATLVELAFGSEGILRFVHYAEVPNTDSHKGYYHLCKGVFQAFRNPVAHASLEHKMTREEVRIKIEFIAYLASLVEHHTQPVGEIDA